MRDGILARMIRRPDGVLGIFIVVAMAVTALAASMLFPSDPLGLAGRPLTQPFDQAHLPLGTDRLGRDVLAGLVHGARTSMVIALSVLAAAACAGAVIGTLAGYFGRWLDEGLMRVADAVQTVPSLVVALAIISVAGPTRWGVVAALASSAWTGPARVVRAQVMALKSSAYVEASQLIGRKPLAIAFDVILPNALGPLIAMSGVIIANAVIMESALAFLGLADPNSASWGAMIAEGRQVMRSAPYLILAPGLAIAALVLGISLVADALTHAMAAERE
ncbi:MAG: ABC transporter permease [Beijerinckiaceae bacterium]